MASDSIETLARHYRVKTGKSFRLRDYDPEDTRGLHLKDEADALIEKSVRADGRSCRRSCTRRIAGRCC